MAFNPYYNTYQPGYYQPPVPDQLAQLRQGQYQQPMQPQAAQNASGGIIWVQGEEGAKAYMVAAGNSVLLMDSENSAFYIKSTDASGMPLPLRVFDYSERIAAPKTAPVAPQTTDQEYVTRGEFNALAARLDTMMATKEKPAKSRQKEENANGEPLI